MADAPAPTPAEPSAVRLAGTLAVAGFIAGVILVVAYLATLPAILHNRAEELRHAVFQVLPGTATMKPLVLEGGVLKPFESPDGALPQGDAVYAGHDESGRLLGYAVPASGAGFQDTIGMLYGFDPEKRHIVGLAVLQCLETPGLGDKIIADEKFHASFKDLAVLPRIVATKEGRTQPNEIDAISGATISSAAVVRALNASVTHWIDVLAPNSEEPRP